MGAGRFLVALALLALPPPTMAQPARELGLGDVVRFPARQGASYEVRLRAGRGELVRLTAESASADLAVDVLDAAGGLLLESDRWDALVTRPEEVAWIADSASDLRVRVRVLEVAPEVSDDVRLRLTERRAPEPEDAARLGIEVVERDAARERRAGTAVARQAASAKFEAAAAAWRARGDRDREARALHDAAVMQFFLGRMREARALYERVLPLRREHPVFDELPEVLNRTAIVTRATGDPAEAGVLQQEALRRFRDLGHRRGESSVLHNMGTAAFTRGEFGSAIDFFERAVAIRRALGPSLTGESLIGLAAAYRNAGDAQSAVRLYGEAIELKREARDREGEARALTNLATAHSVLGDPQRALQYFAQSLAITRVTGASGWQASALAGSGRAALQIGDLAGAAAFFAEELPLAEATGDPGRIGLSLTNLGMVRAHLEQHEVAVALFERAIASSRRVGDRVSEAEALRRRAAALDALGRGEAAAADAAASAAMLEALDVPSGQSVVTALQAQFALRKGALPEALALARRAVALHERVRRRTVDPDLQAGLRSDADDVYRTEVAVLMALAAVEPGGGHLEAALLASERARADGLRRLLIETHAGLRESLPPDIREREAALRKAMDGKERERATLVRGRHTDDARHAIDRDLAALDARYSAVQAELRALDPRYAAWSAAPAATIAELRQVVGPRAVAVHYSLGPRASTAWLVGRHGVSAVRLAPRAEIDGAAEALLALLHEGPRRELQAQLARAARRLAALVVDPLVGRIDEPRIVLVADGLLQLVPFAMLSDAGNGDEPLVERFELVNVPSLATLALLRQAGPSRAPHTALVVADPVYAADDERVGPTRAGLRLIVADRAEAPGRDRTPVSDDLFRAAREAGLDDLRRLPHSSEEAAAVARAGRGLDVELATGFEASRTLLTGGRPGRYRILHVAAHGLINARRPTASGLVLSLVEPDGARADGFLRLRDVYAMQLDADLVVLSACRTALGQRMEGEGLVGLTRGFMHAGARAVISSLWDVRDASAARLMGTFYDNLLRQGQAPAAALRAAQRRLRRQPAFASPHHWAAFVYQGDPDRAPAQEARSADRK